MDDSQDMLGEWAWAECEDCQGTGCDKCNDEGILWEWIEGV